MKNFKNETKYEWFNVKHTLPVTCFREQMTTDYLQYQYETITYLITIKRDTVAYNNRSKVGFSRLFLYIISN